ncbi:hypothetical protein WICPIJ_006968 [Wickerhamomyces pijperi]|uniref:Uncharacterized protein n=1 Tax=Wickerhamomyces pijperi TaxID=599730 RepID=A0A9P8Q0R8_WICPI|nr:hypothetical protein WICPIJ_006968 [Wickerhamomyces pijperi]
MTVIAIGILAALGGVVGLATIIMFPPLAVAMNPEVSSNELYLNIILTCCGWLPGVAHAIYLTLVRETRKQNKDYFTAGETTTDENGKSVKVYKHESFDENEEKWKKLRALIHDRPMPDVPTSVFDLASTSAFAIRSSELAAISSSIQDDILTAKGKLKEVAKSSPETLSQCVEHLAHEKEAAPVVNLVRITVCP